MSVCGDIEGWSVRWKGTPDVSSLLVYTSGTWAGTLLGAAPRGPVLETHLENHGYKKLAWQVAHSLMSGLSAVQPCSLGLSIGVTRGPTACPSLRRGRIGDV